MQLARAPIAVLRLYSAVLRDMDDDGVFQGDGGVHQGNGAEAPVVPASAHHDAAAVATALRWALGLCTLLAADVPACVRVLRCAASASLAVMCLYVREEHEGALHATCGTRRALRLAAGQGGTR